MKNRCVVVAGGDCDISSLSSIGNDDFIIAADSGLKYTEKLNIVPDLIVGDFDSFDGPIPDNVDVIRLPEHKDDTDLLYALRCGVKRGFRNFLILGGYGSRPDQNLAMLQSLVWLCENCKTESVTVRCVGFEIYAIKDSLITLAVDREKYLSVFSISGIAKGVNIIGADYSLQNAEISPNFPIGVSNEAMGEVIISVNSGTLIIMLVNKDI